MTTEPEPLKPISPTPRRLPQTQILQAMEIGLQILAYMDPKEARRLYRKHKGL